MRLNKYEKRQVRNAVFLVVFSVIVVAFLFSYSSQSLPGRTSGSETVTACGDSACFTERFSECKPSTYSFVLKSGSDETVLFNEVTGRDSTGLCVLVSRVQSSSVKALQGRKMTCLLSREQVRGEELLDYGKNCKGSLVDVVAPSA